MSQTLHLIAKDLRRLRWLIAAWLFVIVGRAVLSAAGTAGSLEALGIPRLQGVMLVWADILTVAEILMTGLLASSLVHDEPLIGADAFWLTRPIDRRSLMAAKLALAGALLVLTPLVREMVTMRAYGAEAHDIVLAAPGVMFIPTLAALLLLALAVLTPSLARFVLTIVGIAVSMVLAAAVFATIVTIWPRPAALDSSAPSLPDATSEIVGSFLLMCVALSVTAYQYRHRRLGRAVLRAVIGVVAAVAIASAFPWRFARAAERDPGEWAHDAIRTPAVLGTTTPPYVSTAHGWTPPKRAVAVDVHMEGTPSEYDVEPIYITSSLTFPDGAMLHSAQSNRVNIERTVPHSTIRNLRLQAVLRPARLAFDEEFYDHWPVVLVVGNEEYTRYGSQAGRLTASVHFEAERYRIVGSLPLAGGARLRSESDRFEMIRVRRRADGCSLVVRQLRVQPLWEPPLQRSFHFILRNAARGEAIDGDSRQVPIAATSFGSFLGVTIESAPGTGFLNVSLEYPSRTPAAAGAPRIDAAWLDGAELVVIESASAGRVTRSLSADGFKMRPDEGPD